METILTLLRLFQLPLPDEIEALILLRRQDLIKNHKGLTRRMNAKNVKSLSGVPEKFMEDVDAFQFDRSSCHVLCELALVPVVRETIELLCMKKAMESGALPITLSLDALTDIAGQMESLISRKISTDDIQRLMRFFFDIGHLSYMNLSCFYHSLPLSCYRLHRKILLVDEAEILMRLHKRTVLNMVAVVQEKVGQEIVMSELIDNPKDVVKILQSLQDFGIDESNNTEERVEIRLKLIENNFRNISELRAENQAIDEAEKKGLIEAGTVP
ncbi:MAG: hypothetical protein HOE48_13795 [Candidatus Latescibacteria bacterium]|nr:hypothetical protein [Candidatus Latescibacterota bacterium]